MTEKQIDLDDEARKLFEELGGLDTTQRGRNPDDTDESALAGMLAEEEHRMDRWRTALVEFAYQAGGYINSVRIAGSVAKAAPELSSLVKALESISRGPGSSIQIRFRGLNVTSSGKSSEQSDYVLSFGRLMVDLPVVRAVADRRGVTASHLPGRLARAFEIFSSLGINTLNIRVEPWSNILSENIKRCFEIYGKFLVAISRGATMASRAGAGSLEIVFDEHQRAEANLTMLAGLNDLPAVKVQALVLKIAEKMASADASSPLNRFSSVYDAVFAFKDLKEKLKRPPVEINNVKWLLARTGEDLVSKERALVGRELYRKLGGDQPKAAQLIAGIYGGDFPDIRADALEARLSRVSDFLSGLRSGETNRIITNEVLTNVRAGLEQVQDEVYESLPAESRGDSIKAGLHEKILEMLSFFKRRAGTKKKIKQVASEGINFDDQDYETIAKDFGISEKDARRLIELLKSCFDRRGRFLRGAFEKNIPYFAQYEKRVFEFLWYYLKEISDREDRVAFLNSMQKLISEMKQKGRAVQLLLKDFCKAADSVSFSDRNALILANVLLRKYNKELRNDIELTPEEVLSVRDGLDSEVTTEAATVMDADPEIIFRKMRSVHRAFKESAAAKPPEGTMPYRYLGTLEREVYIFLSLAGGKTAHRVVHGAVLEYGNPGSGIYLEDKSRDRLKMFLQLLQVSARGLGRFEDPSDRSLFDKIRSAQGDFLALNNDESYKAQVYRVMDWAASIAASI